MKVSRRISPILPLKLVAMATSLERSEKGDKTVICDQIPTYGENLVKIGLVDPEIICLKNLFKKKKQRGVYNSFS